MNDTPVTLDQMHEQIVQIITLLDAIPPDQRSDAQDALMLNLQYAIEQFDSDDGDDGKDAA